MRNDILKKIVIAILIVVAILVVLFVGKEIAIRFFGMRTPSISKSTLINAKKIDISFDAAANYEHIATDNYIYFVKTDGVYITDDDGNEKTTISISVENPAVFSAGEYVLVGDIGSNKIYILKNAQIVREIETKKAIKNVSINASGYCITVTEGDMQKREVTLYDEKGEELFVWTSGNRLVFDAVVANNNKNVVISSLNTQGSAANTILSFYNISKEEPIETVNYEDEIVADLTVNGNYVYCIGESKTDIYTVTGAKKSEIPYKDRTILSYVVNDSGMVISFKEGTLSDKRYSIRIYKENGSCIASHEYDYVSKSLDATNNHIVMDRDGLINVIDYNGREIKLIDSGFDIEDLTFVGNSKKIVGFTADGAYIITI